MASINKVKVKTDIYDISPSPNGILDTTTANNKFESSDVAQGSATSWTNVDPLAATETNKSIFTKITQMIKNVRYLYNIIGSGFSTSNTIKNQIDSKAPSNHTHTKSQITDFPSSLKNPTSLTIKGGGTTLATYDGSSEKTVNITKSNIGLGNVDNTADADKSVKYATSANMSEYTVGIRDCNNANNIIKVGWSGTDLDANTLSYVAGYTSDMKIHTASKDGVRSWLGLGASAYKKVQSLSAVGHSDWKDQSIDDGFVPTMAFMAYWNGAHTSDGASNLQYCDRGRFGTIVTKSSGDYAVASHTHSSVKDIGDNSNTVFAYSKAGMNYGDYTWLAGWNGYELRSVNKNQFATASHTHDDRYYTESEINSKLDGKLSTSGGKITGKITKSTSGNLIGDRDRACVASEYPGDSSYGAVAAMATKNGYWTIGNLGGEERLIFNYSTDANYNAGKNETIQVYLPNQAGTIITSATIGSQSVNYATKANSADYLNFTAGNEIDFTGNPDDSVVYFGYRNTQVKEYRFNNGNGSGGLAQVTASQFNGKATSAGTADSATTSNGVKDYNDANKTIKIGFAGAGLNTSNLNYIAGYTENGTKIKDVSKDVLKQWLGATSATVDGTTVVFG